MSVFLFQHSNVLKVTLWPKMAAITSRAQRHLKKERKGKMLGLLGESLKRILVSPIQFLCSHSAYLPTVTDAGKQCLLSE